MAVTKHETPVEGERKNVLTQQKNPIPVTLLILGVLSLTSMLLSIWMIFYYAPADLLQKEPQRIFYLHVPASWVGMLAFAVIAVAGIVYIVTKNDTWDWVARASAEVGAVFMTIALITGSLWAKPVWGAWWVWDAKLTATLLLWFIYVGYLMLRSYMGRTVSSATAGAVLAIVGVVDLPIIYLSVNWWRGQHPEEVIAPRALPDEMLLTLGVALVALTLLYSLLMVLVYRLQRLQTQAERLRAVVE